ncbi:MAG: CapA family protein [Caldilineales bacterium]|nr:CapA family protein [Caldilineales bacterium]
MPLRLLTLCLLILLLAACNPQVEPTLPPPTPTSSAPAETPAPTATQPEPSPTLPPATATPAPPPTPAAIFVGLSANIPAELRGQLETVFGQPDLLPGGQTVEKQESAGAGANFVAFAPLAASEGEKLAERVYAVVAPFATVRDEITLDELTTRWSGAGDGSVFASEDAALALGPVFASLPAQIVPAADLPARLAAEPGSLGILPFEELDPTYKVLAVDGVNPLDNRLQPETYPLTVALALTGPDAAELAPALRAAIAPATNRDPSRLTALVMTGVTAMSRGTAKKMEEKGYTYPAQVISATLAAADITHVSNEVPFIDGCKVNDTYMNLVLCSDYPYWQALQAIGTDIVGLSGNHVNDFGRDGARESLQFYRDRGIPIYGSGLNETEACQPLLWEDHGNTFAFLAALAWWPDSAWATADKPGACYFYDNYDPIIAQIGELSQTVDIVAVELQYHETYNPWPIPEQVEEFRALRAAGADIVTGVQSHVPQASEPYGTSDAGGPGIINYGLGNLFFDQMQDWDTRTELIARHTIYDGRLLSTELLTTILEDFAQPRWATPAERADLLRRVFDAAPKRPAAGQSQLPSARPTLAPLAEPEAATPTPESAPVTTTVPAATTAFLAQPTALLAWPTPSPAPEDHYLLGRPTAPTANQIPGPIYTFGDTQSGRRRPHHGVDVPNPLATPVLAPADATIYYAGPDQPPHIFGPRPDFFGNTVVFRLDAVWRDQPVYVLYGHLNTIAVQTGERVTTGQPVGAVGMTGIAIGPHTHIEVRLGSPDFGNSHNPGLWLRPLAGAGTVAGQLVTPEGRAWTGLNILLYRLEEGGARLVRVLPTYANDPDLRPDPEWAETFVGADLPAGDYELAFKLLGKVYRGRLTVEPGKTSYQRFVVPA